MRRRDCGGLPDGSRRIDAARAALTNLVTRTLPADANLSLRVFGSSPDSCDTRLLVPQSPLDPAVIAGVVANAPVVDGVRTPIAASLQQVAGDLGTAPGPRIVVLVTDGEETCGGDPGGVIARLAASGIDVRVNIFGFALDDAALEAQLTAASPRPFSRRMTSSTSRRGRCQRTGGRGAGRPRAR